MRRMFSKNQLVELIDEKAVETLKGKDIDVEDITCADISSDGDASITGDVAITGDLTVSGSINGEEDPCVKPIYCHPLTLAYGGTAGNVFLTCLIFNNDNTPFTWATLKTFLSTFVGRILVSGGVNDLASSKIVIATQLRVLSENSIYVYGMDTDGNRISSAENALNIAGIGIEVTDDVNKVN